MSTGPVLDPAVIESLRRLTIPGEPDVLNEVLTLFRHDAPRRFERLRNALAAGNIEEVRRAAHSLKGSAGTIGARTMFDVCRQIDELDELASAAPLVDALRVEFDKVESEINRLTGAKE
jgi:HPt (histidine-containing phosphotransfer) domain-containing protein